MAINRVCLVALLLFVAEAEQSFVRREDISSLQVGDGSKEVAEETGDSSDQLVAETQDANEEIEDATEATQGLSSEDIRADGTMHASRVTGNRRRKKEARKRHATRRAARRAEHRAALKRRRAAFRAARRAAADAATRRAEWGAATQAERRAARRAAAKAAAGKVGKVGKVEKVGKVGKVIKVGKDAAPVDAPVAAPVVAPVVRKADAPVPTPKRTATSGACSADQCADCVECVRTAYEQDPCPGGLSKTTTTCITSRSVKKSCKTKILDTCGGAHGTPKYRCFQEWYCTNKPLCIPPKKDGSAAMDSSEICKEYRWMQRNPGQVPTDLMQRSTRSRKEDLARENRSIASKNDQDASMDAAVRGKCMV